MKSNRKLTFGPIHHPMQRPKSGNEQGQVRHHPVKFSRNGKVVGAPRSRKNPAHPGWTT